MFSDPTLVAYKAENTGAIFGHKYERFTNDNTWTFSNIMWGRDNVNLGINGIEMSDYDYSQDKVGLLRFSNCAQLFEIYSTQSSYVNVYS